MTRDEIMEARLALFAEDLLLRAQMAGLDINDDRAFEAFAAPIIAAADRDLQRALLMEGAASHIAERCDERVKVGLMARVERGGRLLWVHTQPALDAAENAVHNGNSLVPFPRRGKH